MSELDEAWEEFADLGRTRRFRRGDRLVMEGARPGVVLLIRRGAVRVVAGTEEGDEVTLAVRGPGDLVGDHAALTGERSGASVVAIDAGEASIINTAQYLEVVGRHPAVLLGQVRRLVERVQEADARLVELTTLSVPARIARNLLRHPTGSDGRIVVDLTQDELAGLCGASRGAVAEVLAQWRERGLVETSRRRITVIDPDVLRGLEAARRST